MQTGRVALGLAARGTKRVVAVVRDPDRAAHLAGAGVTVRRAPYEDAAALREALAGGHTLVLITGGSALVGQSAAALDAARAAGVEKIVRISSLRADVHGPTDATRQDGQVERMLAESGLTRVILRGHSFMQNLLHSVPTIRAEGAIYFGAGSGKVGMIDSRDIADAALAAATSARWDGQVLELTGPEAIDHHRVAAAIGEALGREVRYVPVPPAAVGDTALRFGADPWRARILTEYCEAFTRGWGDFATDDVAKLTGHPPRSIEDFAREILSPAVRGEA